MPLFEVAIIELPTEEEKKNGKFETLIAGPKSVIARTGQVAALGLIKELDGVDLNRLEVLVRPFAEGVR